MHGGVTGESREGLPILIRPNPGRGITGRGSPGVAIGPHSGQFSEFASVNHCNVTKNGASCTGKKYKVCNINPDRQGSP